MAKEFELSPVGNVVWEDRYAKKDEFGNVVEKDVLKRKRTAEVAESFL